MEPNMKMLKARFLYLKIKLSIYFGKLSRTHRSVASAHGGGDARRLAGAAITLQTGHKDEGLARGQGSLPCALSLEIRFSAVPEKIASGVSE